jgi:protein gp37
MLRRTSIGWADYSGGDLNVVIRGRNCAISEGCAHCYVERDFKRYGREMTDGTTIYPKKLKGLVKATFDPGDVPYRRGPGSKPIMFVADYGDLFCEDVPDHFIFSVLDICSMRRGADWVLLTKRPQRMLDVTNDWLEIYGEIPMLPPNIWCLATAENQERADERIPVLLQVRAQALGVSIEPMLEPIRIRDWLQRWNYRGRTGDSKPFIEKGGLSWVIVGAESGPDRRPFKVAWAESIYEQCRAAGVPFFGKQASGPRPGVPLYIIGGREIKEFPQT